MKMWGGKERQRERSQCDFGRMRLLSGLNWLNATENTDVKGSLVVISDADYSSMWKSLIPGQQWNKLKWVWMLQRLRSTGKPNYVEFLTGNSGKAIVHWGQVMAIIIWWFLRSFLKSVWRFSWLALACSFYNSFAVGSSSVTIAAGKTIAWSKSCPQMQSL